MPPFGFGDDQISIFAEIPDVVLPRKQASSFFFFFFFFFTIEPLTQKKKKVIFSTK